MLTPKERLKAIFEGQKVDRPRCICPGGMMNMITRSTSDGSDSGVSAGSAS